MKTEEEIQEAVDELTDIEAKYAYSILADMAGIAKRRLLWVLGD